MNILTDVLSLIRRSVFAKKADLDDVLILGTNEEPDMTGVASPIPYKSIKVIKVRDFKVAAENCNHANSPADPAAGTAQVYQKTESSEVTETCTVFFRSLKSLSSNLTLATSSDDNYIEITTEGEPNTAANQTGTAAPVATVLENTTGNNITWTRTNTGLYRGTWDTALADVNKVFFAPALGNLKNQTVVVNIFSATTAQFQVGVQAQGSLADSELVRTGIEIRIYP